MSRGQRNKGKSRKKRALKLQRRREAQDRQRFGVVANLQGRAGKAASAKSYHKSDPYVHGQKVREACQLMTFLSDIGFEPDEAQTAVIRETFQAHGLEAAQKLRTLTPPTEEQWAELEAEAKRRRRGARGFVKVLTDAGYQQVGSDPKMRGSWAR